MPVDYSDSISRVFGAEESTPELASHALPDAVNTTGGIGAALDAQPGMMEQQARQALTPQPEPQPTATEPGPEIDFADPTAGWYTPPKKAAPATQPDGLHDDTRSFDTTAVRAFMADREIMRHELLPEGALDDASGGLLRASFMLNAAKRHSADYVFTAASTAAALGMTLDSLPKAKELLSGYTPAKVRGFAPGFLRQIQWDYDAAMLWGHDLDAANKLAGAFEPARDPEFAPDSWQAALGRGLASVGDMTAQLVINLARLGMEGAGALAVGAAETGKAPEDINATPSSNAFAQYLFSTSAEWKEGLKVLAAQAKERNAESPLSGLSVWDNPEILLDPRWWLENTPGAVASLLPVMGGYMAAGRAGAGIAGLMLNGNEIYNDMLQAGLADDARTRLYALAGGIGMSALDVLGFEGIFGGRAAVKNGIVNGARGAMADAGSALEKAAKDGWKQRTAWTAGRTATAFLSEGGTEWLQNLTKEGFKAAAGGKDVAGVVNAIGNAMTQLEDFILGGVVGGGMGGLHARGQLAQARGESDFLARINEVVTALRAEFSPYRERAALAQSLEQAAQAADASSLRKASPEVFEKEAAKLIPEDSRQLWLGADDAAVLFQEATTDAQQEELAAALGTTPAAVQEAVETGAPLPVNTAAVLARTEGGQRQKILDGLRATPDGVSGREAAQYDPAKRIEEAMNRLRQENAGGNPATAEGAMAQARSAQARAAEVNKEVTRLVQQMEAAGLPRHVAETYAQLFAQHALAFQAAYHQNADALLRRLSISYARQAAARNGGLFHAMYRAPETDILSFVRRARGEDPKEKASYSVLPLSEEFAGIEFRVTRDMVRHQANNHPDMSPEEYNILPGIVANISSENTVLSDTQGMYGERRYAGTQEANGHTYGYVFDVSSTGRVTLTTFFRENPKAVANWYAEAQKKASKVGPEEPSESQGPVASTAVSPASLGKPSSVKTLRQMVEEVKTAALFQFIGQEGAARLDAAEEATTRLDNLAVARDMEAAGKDAKAIKMATGWERGADGKWRYELDDSGIRFSKSADMQRAGKNAEYARYKELAGNINNLTEQEWQEYSNLDDAWGELERRDQNNFMEHGAKLEEVLEAPELFKAYPELRDVHVIFMRPSTMEGYLGLWNRVGKTIKLNKKLLDSAVGQENKIKNVLLHEIQHAIQENEGFERGGNAALFEHVVSEFNDEIKFLRNNLAQLEKWSGIKDFVSESMRAVVAGEKKFADHWRDLDEFKKTNPDYLDNVDAIKRVEKEISDAIDVFKAEHGNAMTADEMYRHLMGEVEARNTEARMNMSAAERLASLATETEDVAREDQIILREGLEAGAAMSAEGTNAFGVPLSRVTRIEGDVTPADVEAALLELAGRDLPNEIEGITAQVNRKQRDKLNSKKAAEKSKTNGFTRSEHRGIAAKIAEAWRWAAEAQRGGDVKNGQPDLTMRRFVSALNVNGRDVFAWITVKEGQEGARIYSVELMPKEKLRQVVNGGAENSATFALARSFSTKLRDMVNGEADKAAAGALHRSFDEIIDRLKSGVNTPAPLYQLAWHGTPHRFDQFTLDHIGEGEGAQAHGWGLYFAGNREVSERYRESLSDSAFFEGDRELRGDEAWAAQFYLDSNRSVENAVAKIEESLKASDRRDALIAYVRSFEGKSITEQSGQLFEVDIPENDVLLDEDKKLNDQPEAVRAALQKLWVEALGYDAPANKPHDMFSAYDGRRFYRELAERLGSAEAASRALNSLGVKGITYDGRQDGRCFVVFDDEAVTILDTLYQEAAHPLGSISLTPQDAAITIFEGANLSTIPHEAGHFFLDNLITVTRDDGTLAMDGLRNDLARAMQDANGSVQRELRSALAEAEKAEPAKRLEALQALRARLQNNAAQAKAEIESLAAQEKAEREQAAQQGDDGTGERPAAFQETAIRRMAAESSLRIYNRAARTVKGAMDALRGLDQARTDLRTLKEWAGVPPEGELQPGTDDYVKLHETVARGFEQYLMEGKAPSKKLEGVFARLRDWLCKVYQHARDVLGLPITDDVRRVFDRLLASDAQIRQSRKLQNVFAAEREFAQAHAPDADAWQEWEDMLNQAEAEVQAAMDRATLRQRNRRWKDYYAGAMEALNNDPWWEMVDGLSRRHKDEDGRSFGGLNKEGLRTFLTEEQVAELSRARPGLVNAHGNGLPVDTAAQENGFEGGDELATALYDRLVTYGENKKKLAARMADEQLAAEDALAEQEAESGAVLAEADAYGAYLDKMDEAVLRMAARRGYRTQEEQDRFVRNSITPRSMIKQRAFEIIRHATLREITPARYQAMLDRALKERSRALVEGDVMAAVRAVDDARVANELIWSAQYQRSQMESLLKLAADTAKAKPGTWPTLHTEALRRVLGMFNLAPMRGAGGQDFSQYNLRQLMEQASPEDEFNALPAFPGWLLDGENPNTGTKGASYLDLTPAQLIDVENIIKYLRKKGYNERADAKESEAAKVRMDAGAAVAAMSTVPDIKAAPADSLRRTVQDFGRKLYGAVQSLRFQLRQADGFSNTGADGTAGPMERNLQKVIDGETGKRQRLESVTAAMAPHLKALADWTQRIERQYGRHLEKLTDAEGKPVLLPESMRREYGRHWTADRVLALALNCGNASNMARLTRGLDLDYETLAPLVGDEMAARILSADAERTVPPRGRRQGLLTLADWQAVQGVWDAVASLWKDTQDVHERMNGFRPQGVEAGAFTLTDPQTGASAAFKGGYYPVRYDPRLNEKVAGFSEQEDILSRNESLMAVPAAKKGHTQARAEQAPGFPLRLDTGVLLEHLDDATSYIYLGEITRHLDRVTRDPAFREQYIRAFGRQDYEAIRPNLRGLVRKEPQPRGDVMLELANLTRRYLVPWGLAFNLKVAALQMTAIFPGMGDVGAAPVLHGIAHMTRHGLAGLRQIWAVSPYMKSRSANIDQDLRKEILNFNPTKRPRTVRVGSREFGWEDLVNAGMWPIVAVDMLATSTVWIGAYSKRMAGLAGTAQKFGINTESEFHKEAVEYADSVVKASNPDFDPSSRSAFLRAQNVYRLFSTFTSAVTLFAARHKYMYRARAAGKISLGQLARFEVYETLLPAVSMFLFLGLCRGLIQGAAGDDDDEKRGLAKLALATLLDQSTIRLPVFGNAVTAAFMDLAGLGEEGRSSGGFRTALDEPARQISNVWTRGSRALHKDMTDEQAQALVYGAADLVSFFARVPVSKLIRNAGRGYDQWQRGEGTPLSMVIPRPGK